MPKAWDNKLGSLCKILIYGDTKTKKTWWALRAAKAGFNVTLLDGDNGHHIIAKLDEETRKRVTYLPLVDETDDAIFHSFLGRMYLNKGFAMNERTRKGVSAISAKQFDANDPHVYFDPTKLNSTDVLIVDSWSAFCRSMARHFAVQNDQNRIPTGKNQRGDQDIGRQSWEDYGWGKNVTQKVLLLLQSLPCHVVVVAHSTEHTVYETDPDTGKATQSIKSQTMQPLGYSGAQGRILGQFFSDILYTFIDKMGKYRVSTKPEFDQVGGSRILDPKRYSWDELSWDRLIEDSKGMYRKPKNPTEFYSSKAFEFLDPGEVPSFLREELKQTKSRIAKAEADGEKVVNTITEKKDGDNTKRINRVSSSRLKRNPVKSQI